MKYSYEIYKRKNNKNNIYGKINLDDFRLIDKGKFESRSMESICLLEELYEKFNRKYHDKISISDVIILNNNAYVCDAMGFKKVYKI